VHSDGIGLHEETEERPACTGFLLEIGRIADMAQKKNERIFDGG
jgi:hypothetical protein